MEALVRHLLEPIVSHPESIEIQEVESDAVLIVEVVTHEDDREVLEGDDARNLRSVRSILSAAAGSRKATVELVDALSEFEDEDDEDGDEEE
ncbi:MAG: putative RNA-binding protein YlqC (UPF0109 family) [Myxococcota bacterium]|jgi:predicted RNA-binding protein YlqC (UPF0109 family)